MQSAPCGSSKINKEEDIPRIMEKMRTALLKSGKPFTEGDVEMYARHAAVEKNTALSIQDYLGGSIMYTDATGDRKAIHKSIKMIEVRLSMGEGMDTVRVIHDDNTRYTFKYDSRSSLPTQKGSIKYSDDIARAMAYSRDQKSILLNVDGASHKEIDDMFLSADTTSDTVKNIEQEMIKMDIDSLDSSWDAEHSAALSLIVDNMQNVSRTIRDMKIEVTDSFVDNVLEPLGEFDPNKEDTNIRIIKSSLGQEFRNRFTMTNQEAMTHETVHAALDWVFNNDNLVAGSKLKLQLRNLYKVASSKLKVEDLMPEIDGTYTDIDKDKAQEKYDYIFGSEKGGRHNKVTAAIRLQEFAAYLMTNKEFAMAMDKYSQDSKRVGKIKGETIIEMLNRWITNAIDALTTKLAKIGGKTLKEEGVKLVYALTSIQDKYGSKAAENVGVPIDEKISNDLSAVTGKIDKSIASGFDVVFEKVFGEEGKAKNTVDLDKEFNKILADNKELSSLVNSKSNLISKIKSTPWFKEFITESFKARELEKNLDKLKLWIESIDEIDQNAGFIKKSYQIARAIRSFRYIRDFTKNHMGNEGLSVIQSRLMQQIGLGENSFMHNLLTDFSGGRKTLEQITDLTMEFRSHIDRMRDQNSKGMGAQIKGFFQNIDINSRDSKLYNESLKTVVLDSDIQALKIDDISEIQKIVSDKKYRQEKIDDIESELMKAEPYASVMFIRDASALARYIVTGVGLRTNADNISRMFGTYHSISKNNTSNKWIKHRDAIDKLATLKALDLTDGNDKLAELITIDPNGVRSFIQYSRGLQRTTEDEMRKDESQEYVKGQVKDKINSSHSIEMAPMFKREKMKALGYEFVRIADISDNDVDKIEYGIFYNPNANITKRVDGAVSLQRRSIPGLLLSDKIRMSNPHLSDNDIFEKFRDSIDDSIQSFIGGKQDGLMHPVYNDSGNIIDFRYGYSNTDKMRYLDLSLSGSDTLSGSFGHTGTTKMTNAQNEKLIDIVFEDNKDLDTSGKFYKDNLHLYVKIEPKSYEITDEERVSLYSDGSKDLIDKGKYGIKTEGEEMWGLMPPSARKYIVNKNNEIDREAGVDYQNKREMYIRKDLLKQLFAYNDPSVLDIKMLKKLSAPTRRKIAIIESYWKDFMALIKTNVVVKMPSTIIGNILSNAKFLVYAGMSPRKAIDYLSLSRAGLKQWKVDEKLLHEYKRNIASMDGKSKEKYKILKADAEARMEDNPLKPLMDKGMYQSIVEDVDLFEDGNKISSYVSDKIDKAIGEKGIMHDIVQTMFLTKKSTLGHVMLNVTQESDFHFRAATYWHGIESGIKKDKVLRDVTDNFINYSKVIKSKQMQWLDRMGPEAFYKYFSNIQRVQAKRLRENSSRVMMDWAGQAVGISPDSGIFHSNIFSQIGRRTSPFDSTYSLLDGGMSIPILHFLD